MDRKSTRTNSANILILFTEINTQGFFFKEYIEQVPLKNGTESCDSILVEVEGLDDFL